MSEYYPRSAYGTPIEKSLHQLWDSHSFCYRVLSKLLTEIDCFDVAIDLGCGNGTMLDRLAKFKDDVSLLGIDSSEIATKIAREKLGNYAKIVNQDFRIPPLFIRSKKALIYSSGFTANLFPESEWNSIVCKWLNYVDPVSVFIYDSFWWNPELTGAINFDEGGMENVVIRGYAVREKEMQIAKIYDDYDKDLKEIVSFNHCRRPLTIGESFDTQVKELLHKSVIIQDELVTEFCTKVVRKNGD
jgi:hypothetical protein